MSKNDNHREAREILEALATPLGMLDDYGDCMLCRWPIAINNGDHAPYCPVRRARIWLKSEQEQREARSKLWQR